jgi:hypothetical protein
MQRCSFELNGKPMSKLVVGASSFPAFSGLGEHANTRSFACVPNKGPIPPGKYYIFDRQSGGLLGPLRDMFQKHSDWFALYAMDGNIDDDITLCNKIKRGSFRLHAKGSLGISQGCITVESVSDFQRLKSMLKGSKPEVVPGSSLQAYGTVTVR